MWQSYSGCNVWVLPTNQLGFDPCYHMLEVIQHDHANRWYDIGVGKVTDFETVRRHNDRDWQPQTT